MSKAVLIFPHQLFWPHPLVEKHKRIVLVEDHLFFSDTKTGITMHAQKLVLHRASMKAFAQEKLSGFRVWYVDWELAEASQVLSELADQSIEEVEILDPVDDWLRNRWQTEADRLQLRLTWKALTPAFMLSKDEVISDLQSRTRLFQTDFYRSQRKRFGVLMEKHKPLGGAWTFDGENRKAFPKNYQEPTRIKFGENQFVKEAISYVKDIFPKSPGEVKPFSLAVTHSQAERVLEEFVELRLDNFGAYQDAISKKVQIGHHAFLSMYLNIGLLTPKQVLDRVLSTDSEQIPIASLEGFVRQVLGWREFVRGVYELKGGQQRSSNVFGFSRKLRPCWYEGTTGIAPVDAVIHKVIETGYAHHIERLMVLGNLMLLCEIDPDEVYAWFMEMFVDSYDWVMVPNVYGMSQYADGGMMVTKPYVSSSNYILTMSDYKKTTGVKFGMGCIGALYGIKKIYFGQTHVWD